MENSTEINSTSTGADGVVDVNTRVIDVSPFGRLNSIAVLFLSIISVKMAQKTKLVYVRVFHEDTELPILAILESGALICEKKVSHKMLPVAIQLGICAIPV